jgi:hypothetical protein
MNSVPGFTVDLTNVISIPTNSELAIFTTDGSLSINEAKVKTPSDSFLDLVKQGQNSFSLSGVAPGVYTIDVITQKGSASAAYEGILVLGEDPTNIQTRTIIEKQIVEENDDDDDGNNGGGSDGDCDRVSYPDVCIRPFPPDLDCLEIPHRNFKVSPPDPHDFDREGDGIGCESGTITISGSGLDGNETLPPDPCLNDPTLPECQPDPCLNDPTLPECQPDPCEVNPDAEGCQEPLPLINPCDEDPSLPECQEEDTGNEVNGDSADNENGDGNDEGTGGGDGEGEGDGDGDENEGADEDDEG